MPKNKPEPKVCIAGVKTEEGAKYGLCDCPEKCQIHKQEGCSHAICNPELERGSINCCYCYPHEGCELSKPEPKEIFCSCEYESNMGKKCKFCIPKKYQKPEESCPFEFDIGGVLRVKVGRDISGEQWKTANLYDIKFHIKQAESRGYERGKVDGAKRADMETYWWERDVKGWRLALAVTGAVALYFILPIFLLEIL